MGPLRSPAVVVGAGVRTPAGATVDELWAGLCAARPTAEAYVDPRLPPGTATLACRIHDLDTASLLSPAEARRLDRSQVLAVAAATDALAGVTARPAPERCAVVCGVGLPGASTFEEQLSRLLAGGVRTMSPLTIPMVMPSSVAAVLSMRLGFRGPSLTVSAACASGAAAIAEGVELLRRGAADLVLAGGVDSLLGYSAVCGFLRLDAMSHQVACPELASRPFDVDRDGFVMGEGTGFVVLTRPGDAAGLDVLGTVLGHASTADAYHLVAPDPAGTGARRCLELALHDAGVAPGDVSQVNAHGTSTVLNDRVEAAVLHEVFGDDCPPVTSNKGTTGHLIAGSGAVEAVVTLRSLRERLVPPVAGLRTLDPAVVVDVVQDRCRTVRDGCAVSSSFGFGGANTVLVLGT